MDELLSKAGSQAVTFAIRSGISIASAYAVRSVTSFLAKVPDDQRIKLERTKHKLQTRIEIVSSAIDLIKLVASRGNTNLVSTLRLTKDLKEEIDRFDDKIQEISESYASSKKDVNSVNNVELYMLDLLSRIEEAIPLINLSLTTSGANLSGTLSNQVSPGRLLQASNFVNKSNEQFKGEELQIGPLFQLTLYSIFYHRGRIINNRLNEISWKEDLTRADVTVWRKPSAIDEYGYLLKIKENFHDDRFHEEDDEPTVINLDISTITRLFFSASGKLLKLEDRSTPVLVLKINKTFKDISDSDVSEQETETSPVEWLSLGEYEQLYNDSSDESDFEEEDEVKDTLKESKKSVKPVEQPQSLSLLEYILRLCVLQANDQLSILEVNDERLALYLNDENHHQSQTPVNSTSGGDGFETDSSPVRIIERRSKNYNSNRSTPSTTPKQSHTSDVTNRLKKLNVKDEENLPSTPQRGGNKRKDDENKPSPVPGEIESTVQLTPWEKDKISKLKDFGTPSAGLGSFTPSSVLRKKVLRRNLND